MANGENASSNGSNNAKAFGGIIAIVAVIAGVYAMIEPQQQRIDYLIQQVTVMQEEQKNQISESRKEDSRSLQDRASLREIDQGIKGDLRSLQEIEEMRYNHLESSFNVMNEKREECRVETERRLSDIEARMKMSDSRVLVKPIE